MDTRGVLGTDNATNNTGEIAAIGHALARLAALAHLDGIPSSSLTVLMPLHAVRHCSAAP